MTVSQETLTVQNAPRDAALLAGKGAYKLRKLATDLGLLNDPAHKSAFINGKPDEMSQVVLSGLRAHDAQNANGTNGAAPAVAVTPPAAVMGGVAPSMGATGMPPISIPGAVPQGAQGAPPAGGEAPTTTGRKRSPQPASDGELAGLLKAMKESIDTNSQATNTLAQSVLAGKTAGEQAANNSSASYHLLLAMQRTQNLTLSLLLILAENSLGAGQGTLVEDAAENQANFPQVFGAPGKAG